MQIVIDTTAPLSEKDRDILAVLLDLGVPTSEPQGVRGEPFQREGGGTVVLGVVGEHLDPATDDDAGPEPEGEQAPKRRKRRPRCKECSELHFPDDRCRTLKDTSVVPEVSNADTEPDDAPSASPVEPGDSGTAEATDDEGPDLDDAVKAATALIAAGRRGEVKAALATVGDAKRVSELAPDQIPAFLAALDNG